MFKHINKVALALAVAVMAGAVATVPAEARHHHHKYWPYYYGHRFRTSYAPRYAVPQFDPTSPAWNAAQQQIANTYNSIPTGYGKRAYMESLSRQHWLGGRGFFPY
jgi:hypothetical protein